MIGGQAAKVLYAGLVAAGEFQLNIQIPATIPTGDYPIVVSTMSQSSPSNLILPIGSS
jgi:uncharacterized protein (TIGR03437 family)